MIIFGRIAAIGNSKPLIFGAFSCTKALQLQEKLISRYGVGRCHTHLSHHHFICQLQQSQRKFLPSSSRPTKRKSLFPSFNHLITLSYGSIPQKNEHWTLNDSSSPQGLQGDIKSDDATFKFWLENCHRYGLGNCEQQFKAIQSGQKTIEEAVAEQDLLLREIAAEYTRQNETSQSVIAAEKLPDVNMPCPQGIQGDDCARFKMWLENCHQFRFGNCLEQLESFKQGRKTLVQLFEEQDHMIKEAATAAYQRSKLSSMKEGIVKDKESPKEEKVGQKMSTHQKLSNAVAVYGSTVMVFHISLALTSLGVFYTLISSGVDVPGLLTRIGIGESLVQNKLAAGTGTFVVAYAVHKIFAPARIALTLTCTPFIVRYLRQIGFLKKPPKN